MRYRFAILARDGDVGYCIYNILTAGTLTNSSF